MFKVSVITIGDEILIGQIVNTNVAKISEWLTEIGAKVNYHGIIGDNNDDMVRELDYAFSISDFVITTGGLGPTDDDITKPVIAEYFNDNLVLSEITLENIKVMFEERGRQLTPVHYKQAEIPSKSTALMNKVGTAPGIFINEGGKKIIALPGVPAEMSYLMQNEVIPIIKNEIISSKKDIVRYKTVITAGIFESALAELIGPASEYPRGISLAYLPSAKGVRLRIGASGSSFDDADAKIKEFENEITQKIDKYIIGYGKDDLINFVAEILKKNKLTVSVAESCTGGLLGATLTALDGSSAYFMGGFQTYSNEAKINLLKIPADVIDTYGAVSIETAELMAKATRELLKSDIGLSITGIAGPGGGTLTKPVGTICIGYSDKFETKATRYVFGADRTQNRDRSVSQALLILRDRALLHENTSN